MFLYSVASQLDSNYFVRLSDADVPQPDETEALLNDETLQQEAYLLFYVRLVSTQRLLRCLI